MAFLLDNLLTGLGPKPPANSLWTSPLNKGWRALILYNRATSLKPQDASANEAGAWDTYNQHVIHQPSLAQQRDPWYYPKHHKEVLKVDHTQGKEKPENTIHNEVLIINTNTSPATVIKLQNRPSELTVETNPSWTPIKSIGRNNSFQIYTGSDDSLKLDISWYLDQENQVAVLAKCRLLESWTKADGYSKAPPVLHLVWGSSDIFQGHNYILTSATYTLKGFQNAYRPQVMGKPGVPEDGKLLPSYATQQLILKRVSLDNLTHADYAEPNMLKGVEGITTKQL